MKSNKIKEFIITMVKGIGIGISMIIPGVSGGTMAVLMNIYDKILEAITGIIKHFKESILFLLPLIIGAVVGLLGLVPVINLGLSNVPLITVSLFVGLIIGGLPHIYKEVRGKENPLNIIIGLVCMALVIALCFIPSSFEVDGEHLTFGIGMYLFLAGVVSSVALVAPGISGSMTLMVMGVYATMTMKLEELIKFTNFGQNVIFFIPIALGMIVGFVVMSILMKYLLKNHKNPTYFGIIGLIVGSIVTIYYVTITDPNYTVKFDALNISLSIVVLLVGIVGVYLIERHVAKRNEVSLASELKTIEVKEEVVEDNSKEEK